MKWKIEGTDHSGDDVIVMVEADDVETATRQANFAGVKVKAIHPDETTQPAVRLPPVNTATTPGLATPPPGYTGKVIIEREEDESSFTRTSTSAMTARQHLHMPHDAGTIATIASHIAALALFLIGLVVFLHGWIEYGRVYVPSAAVLDPSLPPVEVNTAMASNSLVQILSWQQSQVYIGHMLLGLLFIITAILIEGFVTRMVVNIRDVWHPKK